VLESSAAVLGHGGHRGLLSGCPGRLGDAEPILLAPGSGSAPAEASELRVLNPARVLSVGGTAVLPESALVSLLGP
jgi:hypothetical protein